MTDLNALLPDYSDIRAVQDFDPLMAAEQHIGKSYKEDEATSTLGFRLSLMHNPRKAEALASRADTHYSMSYAGAVATFEDLGFERILTTPFDSDTFEGCVEEISHWWHPDGVLGVCESYTWSKDAVPSINSAKIFYNLRWKDGAVWAATSSGKGVEHEGEILWVGDHDVREGFRLKMATIHASAEFLSPWVWLSWLSLSHYMDKRGGVDIAHEPLAEMMARIRSERAFWVHQFPDHVQQAIGSLDND